MASTPIDYNVLVLILILVIMVGAVATFVLKRKMSSMLLTVVRDFRNPHAAKRKYYAIFDRGLNTIKLYKSLFHPFKAGIIPPVDFSSFVFEGQLFAYRGVSGHPEDDNIVMVRMPILGQVQAQEYSKSLATAVQKTLEFKTACDKFGIGQEVEYASGDTTLSGVITDIGYDGIEFNYMIMQEKKNKDGTTVQEAIPKKLNLMTVEDIANLKIIDNEHNKNNGVKKAGLDAYVDYRWVLNNMGVVPVNDANVILRSQKDYIAEFNSKVNERVNMRQSWLTRNYVLVVLILAVVGLGIGYAIESWATQQYVNGILGHATTQLNGIFSILNNSIVHSTLPAPTTH